MIEDVRVGEVLKQLISEKGIKQSWLAKQLGISSSTLSLSLSGNLSAERFLRILDLIGIKFEEFNEFYTKKEMLNSPAKNTSTSQDDNAT